MRLLLPVIFLISVKICYAQVSETWVADRGNGTYQNPVIHADYSDPDAIRVGGDFYMISSSFNHVPGLPILHSRDLINWGLIGHALQRITPVEHYDTVQHGGGVWAPSIRFHKDEFYIYYPDPDFGIYLTKAKHIKGPWTEPILVEAGKGLIDPCPLWDDNGKVYLVHAYAGSRAGIKSIIVVKQMNVVGTKIIDAGKLVYDGHDLDPTIEGPKIYKRNGYYYIFAPAGGVSTGWQVVLRSKNIYGPYARKVVISQGNTAINGPHQGAWISTQSGEDWFLHFQDINAYGRVVHLQPMKWVNDWPVIGSDTDGNGEGQPVHTFTKPGTSAKIPILTPPESDEFESNDLGLQWQWQANPKPYWSFLSKGKLRLYSYQKPEPATNYWRVPNLLLQKFPAESFIATTKISFRPRIIGERAGLIIFGSDYASLSFEKKEDGNYISYITCKAAEKGNPEKIIESLKVDSDEAWFRVSVRQGGVSHFSYSADGIKYSLIGEEFIAKPGKWVGAKLGLFCTRNAITNDSGFAEFDWFRLQAPNK